MTTERYLRRLNLLDNLSRNSRAFRDLSESLEISISSISPLEFERKDFLMEKLSNICKR